MVDLDWTAKRATTSTSDMSRKSPRLSNKLHLLIPTPFRAGSDVPAASDSASSAYEYYLRLPELRRLWARREFPDWKSEPLLTPALQALEITFRFVSTVLSDPRPYANRPEWKRRLESLAATQIGLIAAIIENEEDEAETRGGAPIADLSSGLGVLARDGSSAEVWRLPGGEAAATVVSRSSETSLLPRLLTWQTSEDAAQKILYTIECEMRRCPYTLGLGEPNLTGKPSLEYDAVCKPSELHSLKKNPYDHQIQNRENQNLYTSHQILESWIQTSNELLNRIEERIESKSFEMAATHCYLLERTWKLMTEIQDLHLLMDPEDFLRLKNQLDLRSETAAFCFRSRGLVAMSRKCRDLKHKVPYILGVEVDPTGGPRVQEAAMRLFSGEKMAQYAKVHLLQALQAIESAMKRFYFAYRQVLVVAVGSLEATANRAAMSLERDDSLSQMFLEPTYFPSLDAAKTFLSDSLSRERNPTS
ncbi:nematode resistance protein-like HSPRO1 [Rhodamnia argentea]|uniref:Nematode resistance protein-like HSPRO1 n=1 Tax=Rhodamnia argentea TaxID=178133 RepID=A0A8B8Q1V3_9MYRT|nr:nematode resistance protein-like HSPRO1 [Rhodamnia argentea]